MEHWGRVGGIEIGQSIWWERQKMGGVKKGGSMGSRVRKGGALDERVERGQGRLFFTVKLRRWTSSL